MNNERGINKLANYVKFLKGTPAAYEAAKKYDDTLYFISEQDDSSIALYLGSRLVAGADLNKTSIDALKDVLIQEKLVDKSFLVYDESEEKWINKSLEEALPVFVGATNHSSGVAGLVPAADLGQTNLFLRSDGTWAPVEGGSGEASNIVNITNESNKTHAEILDEIVGHKGDIVVISDIIYQDQKQQNAYAFDGANWIALNSNLVRAEQVIFVEGEETSGKSLQEIVELILAKPQVSADEVSISVDNNVMSLKNYGVKYYRFIEATDEVEAHYEVQLVDADHPWKADLEIKTVEEDGQIVLGWYEPNSNIIDGINTHLNALQKDVDELEVAVADKANKADVYTKLETEQKIAAAAHLKRREVTSTDDIDVTAADADQYIYMVPSGLEAEDNKYYEYIVVEVEVEDDDGELIKAKKIEKVGSWEVNLSDYAKTADVNTALAGKVDKVDGSFLMTQAQSDKLAGIQAGAQVNVIEAIDGTVFSIGENKTLKLNQITVSQVTNLEDLLNNKVDKQKNARLITNDEATKLNSLANITSVSNDFQIVDGALTFAIHDKSIIATKTEVQTLANRVDGLEAAATWGEL